MTANQSSMRLESESPCVPLSTPHKHGHVGHLAGSPCLVDRERLAANVSRRRGPSPDARCRANSADAAGIIAGNGLDSTSYTTCSRGSA